MRCRPFALGGVTGFVCGERPQTKPCASCGAEATLQCDHPVRRRGGGGEGTCDRWICVGCAERTDRPPTSGKEGDTYDLCPAHARAQRAAPARALVVRTARMGYRGDDWIDVSLQGNRTRIAKGESGGHRGIGMAFAPSPGLLFPYLRLRQGGHERPHHWDEYVRSYTEEMRASYVAQREAWDALLATPEATLLCFCTDASRCHRTVLAGILAKLGARIPAEGAERERIWYRCAACGHVFESYVRPRGTKHGWSRVYNGECGGTLERVAPGKDEGECAT